MRQWVLWRSPLGRSLAVIMVGFTLIPMLILTALGIYNVQVQLQERSLAQTATVMALIQQAVSQWIGDAKGQLASTATQPEVAQNITAVFVGDPAAVRRNLNRSLVVLTTRYFSDVYLVTPKGQIVLSSEISSEGKSLDVDLVRLSQAGKYTWGFRESALLGSHVALMWQPIRDQSRNIMGFLVGQISLESLSSVIKNNTIGMGESGETYLIDTSNFPLTPLRFPVPGAEPPRLLLKPLSTQYNVNGMFSGLFADYAARPVIGVVESLQAPISGSVVVHQQQAEAYSSLNNIMKAALILAVSLMAAAILASILISQRIIQPLQRLSAAAGSMAAGKLDTRVQLVRNDEVGVLADAFNQMASELSIMFSKLAQSNRILGVRAEQLSAMNSVGQQATAALDLHVLLETVTSAIQKTFNYYIVALYLPDDSSNCMVCHAIADSEPSSSLRKNELPQHRLVATNLVGSAAYSRQIINVPDVQQDTRYIADPLYPKTASEICVPLIFGNHLMGVLDIQSEGLNAFVEHDLDVMLILAHQLAIAIRNAELFQDSELARKLADEANQQKSEFLSNMSHELRTPLNVIIGYSSSILSRPAMYDNVPLPPVYESAIKGIMSSGQHLLGVINDILDLSKIEAGQVEVSLEPVDPLPILEGIRTTAIGLVKSDVKVRSGYGSKLPYVMGDELRIRQILLNLVSNAAKFTEHGTITIDAEAEDGKLLFSVSDTGIGIPEDAQAVLFHRFKQVNTSQGGTGLGLSIARQLVHMHGGEIWFESRFGQGSKFFFTIPLAPEHSIVPQPLDKPAEISPRVSLFDTVQPSLRQAMLIDSDTHTHKMLQSILAQRDYDVLEINDAQQALELAELIAPNLVVIHLHQTDCDEILRLPDLFRNSTISGELSLVVFRDLIDFDDPEVLNQFVTAEKAQLWGKDVY